MRTETPKKILIVEDDRVTARLMKAILETDGHEILICSTPFYAISSLVRFSPDLILIDISLAAEGVDGIDVYGMIQHALESQPGKIPMMIVSGHSSDEIRRRAAEAGALVFLEKPFDPDHLLASVNQISA